MVIDILKFSVDVDIYILGFSLNFSKNFDKFTSQTNKTRLTHVSSFVLTEDKTTDQKTIHSNDSSDVTYIFLYNPIEMKRGFQRFYTTITGDKPCKYSGQKQQSRDISVHHKGTNTMVSLKFFGQGLEMDQYLTGLLFTIP